MPLRQGLDILDGMIRKLEAGERIEIADATTLLSFLHRRGSLPQVDQERTLVSGVQDALQHKRGTEFVRNARQLSTLLRTYLDHEESGQRDIAGRPILTEEDTAQADAAFARLEWKYAPRQQRSPLSDMREVGRARSAGTYR